jgi:hypothetical protein
MSFETSKTTNNPLMQSAAVDERIWANVYARAMTETKRQANSRQVVGLVFGLNAQNSASKEATATLQ